MAITISGDSPNLTNASLTTPTLTSPTFAGTPSGSVITSMTAQASTSGTSIDFTSIPSWVKRITVMFSGVSLSGTDFLLVQIGDSGGVENTGYISTSIVTGAGTAASSSTSGFVIYQDAAGEIYSGIATIVNLTANSWVLSHAGKNNTVKGSFGGGDKTLSATLDRVRITSTGTNTFDAGSINILYE
jgi:hypothetical protein